MGWLLSLLTTAHALSVSAFDGKRAWSVIDGSIAAAAAVKHGRTTDTGLIVIEAKPSSADTFEVFGASLINGKGASAAALREADKRLVSGDTANAYKLYIAAAKSYTGQFGELAAVTALELHERLHTKLSKKTRAKVEHRLALATTRIEELNEVDKQEMRYRIARLLLAQGRSLEAIPLLGRAENRKTPLQIDVRRQALLDQAVREVVVEAFIKHDNEALAKFHAGFARLIVGHGDARWLETLVAQAFYELDMPQDAVALLAYAPEQTPIIARELLAARAAYESDLKLRATEHLLSLRPFVSDDRMALLNKLLKENP